MNVTLLSCTADGDNLAAAAAAVCYASEPNLSVLKKTIASGHESVIEHVSFTFKIEGVSRSLLAQLTRHRLASFCVSDDTVVGYDSKNKGITISELYKKAPQYLKMSKLRSVNESSKEIVHNRINKVFDNGIKETFEITTEDGYTLRATKDHQFLTEQGWKPLLDVKVGDIVYTNGVPAYQQKEWLNEKYNVENLSQKEIAALCGISHHTVRSYVRQFGLQKTPGSWSIGKEPPNKGKTKENYEPLSRVSEKRKEYMLTHKAESPRKLVYAKCQGYMQSVYQGRCRVDKCYPRKNICQICGAKGETEIHHIDRDPKNFTDDNLIELCMLCHKRAHLGYAVKAVKPSKVKSIKYYGEEHVYDIEMEAPYHNYIANGFVVHNCVQSQRYCDMSDFRVVVPDSIKKDQSLLQEYGTALDAVKTFYLSAIKKGVPKEDARFILPNAALTDLVVTMNARELRHFFSLRCCNRAQWEIRRLADEMLKICRERCPVLFASAGPGCVSGHCPEARPCGHPRTQEPPFAPENNHD